MTSRRDTYTALLLLAGLAAAVLFLLWGALPQAGALLRSFRNAARQNSLSQSVESSVNDLLDRKHLFIELYGGAQKVLGRRVVDDVEAQYTVVKLTDNVLTFADPDARQVDLSVRGQECAAFAARVGQEVGAPFLYVQAPGKTSLVRPPAGIPDYADEEADQFLSILAQNGVDTLDLRPAFRAAQQDDPDTLSRLFFRTDHHWAPAGAFLGYQTLCTALSERYGFTIDPQYTDDASFDITTYENVFLGSQGKRVGSRYVGTDSIQLWSPKFPTSFSYSVPHSGIERSGPFDVSLLFPEFLDEGGGLYDTNPYVIYSGGDFLLSRAVNQNNPDGPRVVVLRDSFGCAITPFLSLACGELMAVDPRSFDGDQDDMIEYLQWLDPDVVLVLNAPSSLRADALYPYLPTARANSLNSQEANDR